MHTITLWYVPVNGKGSIPFVVATWMFHVKQSNNFPFKRWARLTASTMLQSAKNLVKFVQTINPNKESVIRLGIGYDLEIDAFFYYHKGNGKDMFAKLMRKGLFNLEADENYYRLDGTFDGYRVKVTFEILEGKDLVILERHDPKAGYPELAKCSTHWNYMTPEEWEKFIENAGGHDAAKRKMEFNENGNRAFSSLISGGFAWDESKEGSKYWLDIYYRSEPIV